MRDTSSENDSVEVSDNRVVLLVLRAATTTPAVLRTEDVNASHCLGGALSPRLD